MKTLIALACVLRHRIGEIDQEITSTKSEREWTYLWRLRTSLVGLWHALIGPESPAEKP